MFSNCICACVSRKCKCMSYTVKCGISLYFSAVDIFVKYFDCEILIYIGDWSFSDL